MEDDIPLFVYFLIAPFWIVWKLVKLFWSLIGIHLARKVADKRAGKQWNAAVNKHEDKNRAREEARAAQLVALQAAVPKSLPNKLRATIQLNNFKEGVHEQQRLHNLLIEDSFIMVETRERAKFAVDMILELPEADRALIKAHRIHDIVLEDEPAYSATRLREFELEFQQQIDAAKSTSYGDIIEESTKITLEVMKNERQQTRVGDYFVAPFTRIFDTPDEARAYADKLKSKILPQIRQQLEFYRQPQFSETIEF